MAVTIEEISGWLDQLEYKYKLEDDKVVLMTGDEDSTNIHFVKAKDEGRIFEWSMSIVDEEKKEKFKVKEHEHLSTLLAYLLQLNYTTKFGTWEYDAKDGEIAFNVEIPLEDAKMTFKQFERICSLTMDTLEYTDNIKKILATGEIPENKEDEMMEMLEALLAFTKQGSLAIAKKKLEEETEDGI